MIIDGFQKWKETKRLATIAVRSLKRVKDHQADPMLQKKYLKLKDIEHRK